MKITLYKLRIHDRGMDEPRSNGVWYPSQEAAQAAADRLFATGRYNTVAVSGPIVCDAPDEEKR
jgi:hypothetical protein